MTWRRGLAAAAILAGPLCAPARGHDAQPAFLDLREAGPDTCQVRWMVPGLRATGLPMEVRMPEGCETVGAVDQEFTGGMLVYRWTTRCPGGLYGRAISVDGLMPLLSDALVRFERADGSTQITLLTPSAPSFVVTAAPGRLEAAASYLKLGVEHILGGLDHLLFVLGLLLLVPNRWVLVKTITAFTVAHSLTLAVATLGHVYPPVGTLNALIAMSILFLGPEIVRADRGGTSLTIRHPWVVAFAFGLLHGFGFASGLADLGVPQPEIPFALLMFNVGVEVGQLLFVLLLLALAVSFGVLKFRWSAWQRALPAYVVGSLGAAWTIQRVLMLVAL